MGKPTAEEREKLGGCALAFIAVVISIPLSAMLRGWVLSHLWL